MWPKQLVDLVNVYIEQSKIILDPFLASATLFIIYCVWSLSLDIVLFESAVSCGNNILQIVLFVLLYRGEPREATEDGNRCSSCYAGYLVIGNIGGR